MPILVSAADITIRGYVYDASTNAVVSGAKAVLQTNALSATTDSKGFFSIEKSASLTGHFLSDIGARVRVEGEKIEFTVPEGVGEVVSLRATDLNGRNIALFDGAVAPGTYSLPLSDKLRTSGVYLLTSSIGSIRTSHKICLQSGRFAMTETVVPAARATATAWDTLIVTKSGYATTKIALASSSDSLPKVNLKPNPISTIPVGAGLDADPLGFAMVGGTTTGGGSATPTVVKTCVELKAAAADKNPRVIRISGTIKTTDCNGGSALSIASNKTIIGADKNATIYGGLVASGQSNIILRNFNMQGIWPNSGPDDAIAFHGCKHFWADHLNIWDGGDGNLDITTESSYGTVSWCKFWYTDASHPHRLCGLIGSGGGDHPEDWGNNKITYHHNWFGDLVKERQPRLMYGQAHVYNDYYTNKDNGYCIGFGSYGSILVENNYFKGVKNPISFMYDVYAWIVQRGNTYDGTSGTGKDLNGKQGARRVTGQDFEVQAFDKTPYSYTLTPTADVPTLVSKYAGPM